MVRELVSAGCVAGFLSLPDTCLLFAEIARFNLTARDVLRESKDGNNASTNPPSQDDDDLDKKQPASLHEYLQANSFTETFQERYLLPLVYALWNLTHREEALALPVAHVAHRLWGMRLLQMPFSWPVWVHPTASLVGAKESGCSFPADGVLKNEKQVHRNCRVTAIQRDEVTGKYRLLAEEHGREAAFPVAGMGDGFDHVVIATPGDVAREILRDLATEEEDEVLSAFRSERVVAVVQRASVSDFPSTPERSGGKGTEVKRVN
ncbi:hypothetical protein KEM55_008339 [Ascosphaera atra]|nr:hypothetical protein KEM55_008339 [Ascosphaera atra]